MILCKCIILYFLCINLFIFIKFAPYIYRYIRALLLPSVREAGAPLPVPLRLPLPLPAAALKLQTLRLQACRRLQCLVSILWNLITFLQLFLQ